ncbi:MAG: DUF2213 domain-containing protein [Shewanella sp.]
MLLHDALILDAPRRTKDGFMAVRAKAARSGVYDYLGSDVDPSGARFKAADLVKVYRPEDEVFSKASVASFFAKPITDNHPAEAVTADNWKSHARGAVMGAIKDGEYLAFDLVLMDSDAIKAVDSGRRELSNGYACDLSFEDGIAPDGTAYQAVQRNIRGNHVALVDRGRAGPECRINDAFAVCDSNPAAISGISHKEPTMKKIVMDGLQVDLSDADAVSAAITKLQGQVNDGATALADAQKAHDKAMGEKDAKIADLEAKVIDEAKIDALADAKAEVVAKAKALLGDKLGDIKGKSIADIRRTAVAKQFGDTAVTDKSDDYVEARFDAMSDAKADPLRSVISDQRTSFTSISSIRDAARVAAMN